MKDLTHYVPLLGIYIFSIWGFVYFSFDRNFQVGIALGLAASHVAWGVVHHIIHKDISLIIVLEYIAVSALGFLAILSIILRV